MNVSIGIQVGAKFKLVVHKGDGVPVRESAWFNNIVLNSGLARLSNSDSWAYDRCLVGAGNSLPTQDQSQLDALIAASTTIKTTENGKRTSGDDKHVYSNIVWSFGQGVAAGNISEVALAWSNTGLFNRALIRDINNNPTTITVLADEYLDVISEVRGYMSQGLTGSFSLLDKFGELISTHNYTCSGRFHPSGIANRLSRLSIASNTYPPIAYTGDIQSQIDSLPSGTGGSGSFSVTNTYPAYNKCRAVVTIPLGTANITQKTIVFQIDGFFRGNNSCTYQAQIDPPITKTNTQIMTYTVELTWSNYEPT